MGTWLFSIGEKESVFLGLLNLLNRRRIQVSMCHQQKCPKLTLHEDLDAQFQYLDRFFFFCSTWLHIHKIWPMSDGCVSNSLPEKLYSGYFRLGFMVALDPGPSVSLSCSGPRYQITVSRRMGVGWEWIIRNQGPYILSSPVFRN